MLQLTYASLVNYVADKCNNTINVVNTVDSRLLTQWVTHENVTGILYGGPLGQSSGHTVNDVLFGHVNPSSKLVHTIAKNESDYHTNTQISDKSVIMFSECNYIDYKYSDQENATLRYERGFGLSYTTFKYGNKVDIAPKTQLLSIELADGREDLWDIVAEASTDITNPGDVAAAEVAQVYVEFPAAADEPVRQLGGFHKVEIEPRRNAKG